MNVRSVFMTTTSPDSPLDASGGTDARSTVSDFVTVQSLTNFAAMTAAITAAWHALERLLPAASTLWVPFSMALLWGVISILLSLDGLRQKTGDGPLRLRFGTVLAASFLACVNSLVLFAAVIGTAAV